MKKYLIFTLTALLISVVVSVPAVSDEDFAGIFEQNKIMILHAHLDENAKYKEVFDKFCAQGQASCADLSESYDNFGNVLQFLGCDLNQFFFILDTTNQKKYVLDATEDVTVQQLESFYKSFQDKTLEPFYASEPAPETDDDSTFRRLVGSTLDDFLALPAPFKVLFLTTNHPICQICPTIHQGLEIMAKNMSKSDVIIFGHIDIMKNDHKRITNEAFPYFLVFKQGRQQPIEVKGQDVEKLLDIIIQSIQGDLSPQQKQQLKRQKQQMEKEQANKNQEVQDQDELQQDQEQQKQQVDQIKKQIVIDQATDL